jgi:N-acetylmuramoyl-L-alanine amidase/Bacterial SH3 domain
MQTSNGFTVMSLTEFEAWMATRQVARTILTLQEHHTYSPAYANFRGNNHFQLLVGMRNYHVSHNGWSDIGQHFTIFPDGLIGTGRSLERTPACIKGRNANAICIENIGNFDLGGDTMTGAQRESIIRGSAAIIKRFSIPVNTDKIVYHHWFDLSTGERTDGNRGIVKTCPGTGFFGGNKVADAKRNFIPLIHQALDGNYGGQLSGLLKFAYVTATILNIRSGPSANFQRIGTTTMGSILRIYEARNGWYRIAKSRSEWVSGNFVMDVVRATVHSDQLNVRSGPGTGFSIVGSYVAGEDVFIFSEVNGWAKIGLDDRWISASFVTKIPLP